MQWTPTQIIITHIKGLKYNHRFIQNNWNEDNTLRKREVEYSHFHFKSYLPSITKRKQNMSDDFLGAKFLNRFCRQFCQRWFWPKILKWKRKKRHKKIIWWKCYRIRRGGFIMANSSLVPNTKLLGHTNIQKAKFEKCGSEEAKVALCVS